MQSGRMPQSGSDGSAALHGTKEEDIIYTAAGRLSAELYLPRALTGGGTGQHIKN